MTYFNNIKSLLFTACSSGLVGIAAKKSADTLGAYVSKQFIPGWICGSSLIEEACRWGSIGRSSILCPERIHFLQPLKPLFHTLGTAGTTLGLLPVYAMGLTPSHPLSIFILALNEELLCRELLQRRALRGLQEKVLSYFLPETASVIDHPLTKSIRILAASLIFGLLHAKNWECIAGGTISQIAAGIFFGLLSETDAGILGSSIAHAVANWPLTYQGQA